jgi:hypothetical protein
MLGDKKFNLTNMHHCIYVASVVTVEEIHKTGNYSSPTKYDITRPWVTRKLQRTNDVREDYQLRAEIKLVELKIQYKNWKGLLKICNSQK